MRKTVILILILCNIFIYADFSKAVTDYRDENYTEALKVFQAIPEKDSIIYYNIANCHFRLGNKAMASAYYLKAIQNHPSFREAYHNLSLISPVSERPLSYYFIPLRIQTVYLLFWIALLLFLICIIYRKRSGNKALVATGIFTVIFVIMTVYAAGVYIWFSDFDPAVVKKDVIIHSSPSEGSPEIGKFFEGAVLDIRDKGKNFWRVTGTDGLTGWVTEKQLIDVSSIE